MPVPQGRHLAPHRGQPHGTMSTKTEAQNEANDSSELKKTLNETMFISNSDILNSNTYYLNSIRPEAK